MYLLSGHHLLLLVIKCEEPFGLPVSVNVELDCSIIHSAALKLAHVIHSGVYSVLCLGMPCSDQPGHFSKQMVVSKEVIFQSTVLSIEKVSVENG